MYLVPLSYELWAMNYALTSPAFSLPSHLLNFSTSFFPAFCSQSSVSYFQLWGFIPFPHSAFRIPNSQFYIIPSFFSIFFGGFFRDVVTSNTITSASLTTPGIPESGPAVQIVETEGESVVANNLVRDGGGMRFGRNEEIFIESNIVYYADIRCVNNDKELATGNLAFNCVTVRWWFERSIGPKKKINVAWDSLIRLSGVILDLPDPGPGRLFF